ncbi:mast cell protease 1-like [Alligator sinensis]|uniref:Mast cell protease 1-like n=1 Tax=Alligator sinensis TaxID=38654 RepID=A0A1U8DLS3_ALLSI|nr:mast cell protease 1-like [Alligator sinensis]
MGPAGEIIGGWEAKPHSRPYMAFVKISGGPGQSFTCGRFLVAKITRAVKLIRLPQAEDVMKPGTTCSVAGWGLTGVHRSQKTKVLREVELQMANK